MNHRLWILFVTGCAAHSSTPLPNMITPPGPPPPSLVWKGSAAKVGTLVVTPQAHQVEDGTLGVTFAIEGDGLAQITGSDVELEVQTDAGLLHCHQPGPPSLFEPQYVGVAPSTVTGPVLVAGFDCDVSIQGRAELDFQIKGAHTRFAMELRPS